MVTTLFFMWGFLTCLNDILVPHLKLIFDLSYLKIMFIQFAFFSTYFVFALPLGRLVESIGYKWTMGGGLFTMGAGLAVSWLTLFLEGFVGIAVGLVTLFAPTSFTEQWLVVNIAAYAVITGGIELAGAWTLKPRARGAMVQGNWLLGLNGVVSLLFGLALFTNTGMAHATLILWLGVFALVSGLLLLAFAFNVKGWRSVLGSPVVTA